MLGKANYRTLRGAVNIGMMQFAFPRTPFLDSFRVAGDSGIESLAPWAHAGLHFTREPTWPAGRKRKAEQTSPMATWTRRATRRSSSLRGLRRDLDPL
jgi:hypothetical protein